MAKKPNQKPKEAEECQLKQAFEEEIKKPYYNVFYLDEFKLPCEELDVSIVIVTYNRCPYKPGTLKEAYNPLVWAIKTALYQKPSVKEIIIVNDASSDYTDGIVKKYLQESKSKGIRFEYIKNKRRIGPDLSRNVGVAKASAKYIHFVDDDCFIPPYSSFGAVFTFESIEKEGIRIGAVNLPMYTRSSIPKGFVSKKKIGSISFLEGTFTANKDKFPEEYLKKEINGEKFLNSELQILEPFPIFNANTTSFLCSKKAFNEIGGFPRDIIKRMGDREFGCRLIENGFDIYFQPDPKFHCVHGLYGLKTGKKFEGEDWFKKIDKSITIRKAMELCDLPAENTGTRMNYNEHLYESIQAFFCLAYLRNKKGAMKWIKRVYDKFVKDGETASLFGGSEIPSPNETERKKIWETAIKEGLEFIKNREKNDIKNINSVLKKLQKGQETPEGILDLISN